MRLLLLLFSLQTLLYSSMLKSIEILEDNATLNFETITTQNTFKKTSLPFVRYNDKTYWVKVTLPKNLPNNEIYVAKFDSKMGINSFIFDSTVKESPIKKNLVTLSKDIPQTLYLKVINPYQLVYVDVIIQKQGDYFASQMRENTFYGIAYGIILSAIIYYLAFFLFNRQKSFLYYALTQAFLLLLLIFPTDTKIITQSALLYDFCILGFVIFSNLFTKKFLETKRYTPKFDKFLTFMIFLYIFELFTYFFSTFYLPTSLFMLSYLIAALIIYDKTGFKPILFYIAGWSLMIFSFIFTEFQIYFFHTELNKINIENILHLIAPMESLILAFALSYKMKILNEKNIEKERLLIHQNKLASMGEMISNIAHQWRQPLTQLSYIMMNIKTAFAHGKLDNSYLEKKYLDGTTQLTFMSETIDDFKAFYTPKPKAEFNLYKASQKASTIASSLLQEHQVMLTLKGDTSRTLYGYANEYSQVILNLIQNAVEAAQSNAIQNPEITIHIKDKEIWITDNCGGIPKKQRAKIFDAYFTTKKEGSGIGLYMSRQIIQKHFESTLTYQEIENGTTFVISI
ncbi:MAG: sensor histidine kinase [Epsilonproteobacteria bacterium]|nr:sensor histidine kinase [Campylobacterota bacterium]